MSSLWKKILLYSAVGLAAIIIGGLIAFYVFLRQDLPSLAKLENYEPSLGSQVFDKDENLIYEFFIENRVAIDYDKTPQSLINAFLAVEDREFFDHGGINYLGIMRAMYINMKAGRFVQGGSTITQQLARNLFLTHRKNMIRKFREALLTVEIEDIYSKEEIFKMYLEQIYLGHGNYGIETAAMDYFGKHYWQLDLGESAMIAGLVKAPNYYSPRRHYERAKKRQKVVLQAMVDFGVITQEVADREKEREVNIRQRDNQKIAGYFIEEIRRYMEKNYGNERLFNDGLKIYTTLDSRLQAAAEQSLQRRLTSLETKLRYDVKYADTDPEQSDIRTDYVQGAVVSIEPATGYVRALVGGRNFRQSKWNRATQMKRQPGSSFKPIIYSAALDNGFTPATMVLDAPVVVDDGSGEKWTPSNYDGTFRGEIRLRTGLRYSINTVSIKLIQKLGVETVIAYARKFGINSDLPRVLSLAIGSCDITPLELTTAYCVLPNQGVRIKPIFIKEIRNRDGDLIEKNEPVYERVLSAQTSYLMTNMLQTVVDEGTGRGARSIGFDHPAAGKTGTTNDFYNAWFIGFSPYLVTGVWTGFDELRSLGRHQSGAVVALPIWADVMRYYHEELPKKEFGIPEGVVKIPICMDSGLLPSKYCPQNRIMEEWFIKGTEPSSQCDVHRTTLHDVLEDDVIDPSQQQKKTSPYEF